MGTLPTLLDMLGTRFRVVRWYYAPNGEIAEDDFQDVANLRPRQHLSNSIAERKLEI